MKRALKFLPGGLCAIALLMQINNAAAQTAGATNAPDTGPLSSLVKFMTKTNATGEMPAKLCSLLWPESGSHKRAVTRLSMPNEDTGEERILCLRKDNKDLVLIHRTETKPHNDKKKRRELYYRTTVNGDLVLALSATFEFEIDDVDNEILKNLTYETYGETSGDGKKPVPITAEIKKKFEEEKKFWLGVEKNLRKKKHRKQDDLEEQ